MNEAPAADTQPRPVPPPTGLAPGTVGDWLRWGRAALAADSDSADADAMILLAALLGAERAALSARAEEPAEAAMVLRYVAWIERRKQGEPVAYITGRQGFWTLDLAVDSSVLIPRPDTEALVEWALHLARYSSVPADAAPYAIADLGTGSGAIALALAEELGARASVTASDFSPEALNLARENARAAGLSERVEFLEGSWFAPLAGRRFHLIVSNPPYIADHDPHLAALRYEPRLALTAGADGLAALSEIATAAPAHLHPQGWLLLEHGNTQGEAVRALLRRGGFMAVETRRDFGGQERVTGGRLL